MHRPLEEYEKFIFAGTGQAAPYVHQFQYWHKAYNLTHPGVLYPLFTFELVRCWAHELFRVCNVKETSAWCITLDLIKQQIRTALAKGVEPRTQKMVQAAPREAQRSRVTRQRAQDQARR